MPKMRRTTVERMAGRRHTNRLFPHSFLAEQRQSDVVKIGDPGRGGRDGAAAMAQDLAGVEASQGVFDAGADFAVPDVVVLLPGCQFAAATGFA
jgi:hypothetical protein